MLKYPYILFVLCLSCLTLHAQQTYKVKGTVVDFLTSQPVAKSYITIKGFATDGAEASVDGTFEINVGSLYSVLIISYPGYQTKEYPLFGKEKVSISLVSEGLDVGESVVHLPYYSINQKDLNGAYKTISNGYDKTIQNRDIYQMLQGTVSGLAGSTYSGVPGEGAMFNLGGIRSLYTTNDPLIVVDGLIVVDPLFKQSVARGNIYNYLSDINVKDIESITILRDASASGIYGSRAANGAIVITTKEGTNKTFLDVSIQQGLSPRFQSIPVMNASEYQTFLSQRIDKQGLDQQTIESQYPFFSKTNNNYVDYRKYANNTDWQKEVTRNAISQDYFLNLRGGDATSKYSFSVGYNTSEGVGKGITINRLTSRFNLDFKISKKLSAGTRISFSRTVKELMDQGFEERVNPLYLSLIKAPILAPFQKSDSGVDSPFYDQPSFDRLSNPVAVIKGVTNDINNFWILGSVFAQYKINNSLKTKIQFGIDRRGLDEDRFTPANGIVPVNFNPLFDRTSEEQMINRKIMTAEHTLTFDKQFDAGNYLMAFGGYNIELSDYSSVYGYSIHSSSDDFKGLGNGQKLAMNGINETTHNISAFANVDYIYHSKLFLKAGLRVDGSSKFGDEVKGNKLFSIPVAVLPYAGLTWKMKGESWMRNITFLDEFSLRGSWGITANQDIPVNGKYSLYESDFYRNNPGMAPSSIGNNSIKWETTTNYNAGLDISMFRKAIGVTFDYFNTKTTDLLVPKIIDGASGFNYYWGNGGTLKNHGIELGLNTFGNSGKFLWKVGITMAKYINKVSDLPLHMPIIDGLYGYTSIVQDGSAAGLLFGYRAIGVFSNTAEVTAAGLSNNAGEPYRAGDIHYADLNGDHIINESDKTVIGNPNPKCFGGITTNFSYKNFELDAILSYSYGNDILNVLRSKLETSAGYENQSIKVMNRWMADGDITGIPNTLYSESVSQRLPSSLYIEDGSYLKLRSLILTYRFKKQIGFARSFQLYLTGYNLITFTKYLGWDPEVTTGQGVFSRGYDFGNYPQPRTFMLGIKVGL